MPHFFFKTRAESENPGRWTHDKAKGVTERHKGKLKNVWHDDPDNPQVAYMLIEDGDLDGMKQDLHAYEVTVLHTPRS